MDIIKKIKELGFSENDYVIVGGALLVALGLLEWDDDIDIAVTPETFERLKEEGWRQTLWQDKMLLKKDFYEVGVGFGKWNLKDLQQDSWKINGIPFIGSDKLLTWKRAIGREKDLVHIKLLEEYLRNN